MQDGYKQTVSGLLRKHRELLKEIADASALLSGKQSALDAIEAALRVFDPTIAPSTEHRRRGENIDGLHRFILEMLRRDGAVTTLSVAGALIEARGLDGRDKALATAIRKRAGDALQKMRRQGRVTGEPYRTGGELDWPLAGLE